MRKTATIILAVFLCSNIFGAAGKLTEVTGPTQVTRDKDKLEGKIDLGIEMNDTLETLKARAGITFEDGTKVQCTEFSRLVIDEFVYDPSTGKGKLALKASLGTVRYASGLIAKNSREDIKVKTPTASVSVRGTDFSMTVDELGRSLIILLPSLPDKGPPVVGTITVSNAAGSVTMNKAYQATLVSSMGDTPSAPVLLNFSDESSINSNLILSTPKSVVQAAKETKKEKQSADNDDGGGKGKVSVTQVAQAQSSQQASSKEQSETAPAIVQTKSEENKPVIELVVNTMSQTSQPSTSSNGFTSDGVNAILTVNSSKGVVVYKVKGDTSASFSVTNIDGTASYPLNFGDKLKVNIIQK
jgi:hypothetical protein